MDSATIVRLRAAFPSTIETDVDAALRALPTDGFRPTESDIGPVRIAGEELHIPSRIYSREPASMLSGNARTVLACLYTRHHNGYVREKYLQDIIAAPLDWVPPFVLQLLGEYVLEIQQVIETNIAYLRQDSYARFIAENPQFIELTKQRAISYWDCYFRRKRRRNPSHAAFRVLEALGVPRIAGRRMT